MNKSKEIFYDKEKKFFLYLMVYVSRFFMNDEEIVIFDLFVNNECLYLEKDLINNINMNEQKIRSILTKFLKDKFIIQVQKNKNNEKGSSYQTYYCLNNYIVYVIDYRIKQMESELQKKKSESDIYICNFCNATYSQLDAQTLPLDAYDAHFLCFCNNKIDLIRVDESLNLSSSQTGKESNYQSFCLFGSYNSLLGKIYFEKDDSSNEHMYNKYTKYLNILKEHIEKLKNYSIPLYTEKFSRKNLNSSNSFVTDNSSDESATNNSSELSLTNNSSLISQSRPMRCQKEIKQINEEKHDKMNVQMYIVHCVIHPTYVDLKIIVKCLTHLGHMQIYQAKQIVENGKSKKEETYTDTCSSVIKTDKKIKICMNVQGKNNIKKLPNADFTKMVITPKNDEKEENAIDKNKEISKNKNDNIVEESKCEKNKDDKQQTDEPEKKKNKQQIESNEDTLSENSVQTNSSREKEVKNCYRNCRRDIVNLKRTTRLASHYEFCAYGLRTICQYMG
ncbi:transcription initiation factor IIE, alpha subunit, putative [Plasmodium malariae]|uniref:Transcription initiation factor IIE, alpha subunit, putative n=1 Tax=Plasmodium malariae TaxID=5858 RepID=A0A1A8XBI4_PLAMA|nr:transcription initiation factor IIE, alpha subunit, putative [Plasmodium malariae]